MDIVAAPLLIVVLGAKILMVPTVQLPYQNPYPRMVNVALATAIKPIKAQRLEAAVASMATAVVFLHTVRLAANPTLEVALVQHLVLLEVPPEVQPAQALFQRWLSIRHLIRRLPPKLCREMLDVMRNLVARLA